MGMVLPTPSVFLRAQGPARAAVSIAVSNFPPFISRRDWEVFNLYGFFQRQRERQAQVVFTSLKIWFSPTPRTEPLHFYPRAPQGNGQTEVGISASSQSAAALPLGGYFCLRLRCRSFQFDRFGEWEAIGRSDVVMLDEAAVTVLPGPLVAQPSR